jgi:ankyrin repeat protein
VSEASTRLPRWLQLADALALAGTLLLAARLGWEQTVWSWERGPQRVGWALVHGAGFALFICPALLILCAVIAAILTVRSLGRGSRVSWSRYVFFAVSALAVLAVNVPYAYWRLLFSGQLARSPHAAEFLIHDAAVGDVRGVRALLSHQVPPDAADPRTGRRALHAAAGSGRADIVELLLTSGANVNAVDSSGDSPLDLALAAKRDEMARLLVSHGATPTRADDTRRGRAKSDSVRLDVE